MDVNCENCGSKVAEDFVFCDNCGQRIGPVPSESKDKNDQIIASEVLPSDTTNEQVHSDIKEQAKADNKKVSTGNKFINALVSVIFCLLIFIFATISISIATIRHSFSENTIADTINDIKLSEIQVGAIAKDYSGFSSDDEATISEFIYENLDPRLIDVLDITEKDIKKIVDNEENKEFIIDKLNDYSAGLINKTDKGEITKDEIMELIENNEESIYDLLDYKLTAADYDFISEEIDSLELENKLSLSTIDEENNLNLDTIRFFISNVAFIIVVLMTVSLVILLFIVNKRSRKSGLIYAGITFLLVGLVFSVFGLLFGIITGKIATNLLVDVLLIDSLLKRTRIFTGLIGIIVILAGSLMLVLYSIINKKAKKNKKPTTIESAA